MYTHHLHAFAPYNAVAQARPGRELQQAPWEVAPAPVVYQPLANNDKVKVDRVVNNLQPVTQADGTLGFQVGFDAPGYAWSACSCQACTCEHLQLQKYASCLYPQ